MRGIKGELLTDVGGIAAAGNYSEVNVDAGIQAIMQVDATHLYSPPASTSTSSPSRRRWSFRV